MWELFRRSGADNPKLKSDLGQLMISHCSPRPRPEISTRQCLLCFPLRTFVSSQSAIFFNHLSVIPPLSNLVWCKHTHTSTHGACMLGWIGSHLVTVRNTNTLPRGHASQIRPCWVTDRPDWECSSSPDTVWLFALYQTPLQDLCLSLDIKCLDPHCVMWSLFPSIMKENPIGIQRGDRSPVCDNKNVISKCSGEECVSERRVSCSAGL